MARELFKELDKLKKRILVVGGMVEDNLRRAVKSFAENDSDLAVSVEKGDKEIDRTEIEVEEECLRILALYQPVASDLRFVVTVLKINNDLERIGDLAVKIAQKVQLLNQEKHIKIASLVQIPEEFTGMFDDTIWLLRKSLDSFVQEDADLAYKVCIWDDEVDRAKKVIRERLELIQSNDPSQHVYLAILLGVSRSLERIADHATNIAEDVIYMLQGGIVRHDDELS